MWGWREHEGPREEIPVARQHSRGNSHEIGVHMGRGDEVRRGLVARKLVVVARELLLVVKGVVRFIPVIEIVGVILEVLAGNFLVSAGIGSALLHRLLDVVDDLVDQIAAPEFLTVGEISALIQI